MIQDNKSWAELALYFKEAARGRSETKNNLDVLNEICQMIFDGDHDQQYRGSVYGNRLFITHREGTHPNKYLTVESIDKNRLEIVFHDEETGCEYCFFPHPLLMDAFDKFREIFENLRWHESVGSEVGFFKAKYRKHFRSNIYFQNN